MFLLILELIWKLGILVWIVYSTVFTIRRLFIKLKEKRKE